MKLFFHIRVSSKNFHFSDPVVSLTPDVQFYDVDNFSDTLTISTGSKAIEHSEKLFLFIEAHEDIPLGGISKLLNQLGKQKTPFQIAYHGDHAMLNKMILRFKENLEMYVSNAQLQKQVQSFFNPG